MGNIKYVLFGAAAGLCFLIVYFVGRQFIFSLILALLLFGVLLILFRKSKGQVNVTIEATDTKKLAAMITGANAQIAAIEADCVQITDLRTVAAIRRLCEISGRITSQAKDYESVKDFLEYYLPVLQKVVHKYAIIEKNRLYTPDSITFKEKTAAFCEELEPAFNKQLEALFHNEMVDLSLEMQVVKTTLKTEGLLSDIMGKEGLL